MVLAYFIDLDEIVTRVKVKLASNGVIALIVGNSAYAGITVDTAEILKDIARNRGLKVSKCESVRVMRTSSQQTKNINALNEWLILLR
jgi:hypothetical protein